MNRNWFQLMLMIGLAALVCLPLLFHPSQVQAHSSPKVDKQMVQVYLNGKKLSFSHTPFLTLNHSVVPVREFLTALGVEVQWNQTKQIIKASKNNHQVILTPSSGQAQVNGKKLNLPIPVQLIQGKAFAPLRILAEAFGAKVHWQASDRSVRIQTGTPLSYKDAENLVRKHLKIPQKSKTIIEYDHDGGDGAYVLHVYDIVQHEGQTGMTATQGWYTVDSLTGKIQSMF